MADIAATSSMAVKSQRRVLLLAALFILAILPFLPAIAGQYMWDDDKWLVNNAAVHAWDGLLIIWNPLHQYLHFYPLTFTLLWLQHKLWALNPIGYHAVNMFLHALATLLLYRCLKYLNFRAAWLGALLWAIHPVQVESVAWIAEIKNVLSAVFYYLSALLYLKFALPTLHGSPPPAVTTRRIHYALSLHFFICALLSKTVTVTLPAGLLILLWARRQKLRTLIPPLIPFFIVGLSIAAFTAQQEKSVMESGGATNLSFHFLERLIIAGKDVWFYLRTLLVPYPLLPVYPRWTYLLSDPLNYLPALAVIALTALLFILQNKITRWPFAAFLYFVATLSPALGFINFFTMHYSFVADHYQYLACAAPLILLAEALVNSIQNKKPKTKNPRPLTIIAILIPLALLPLTAFYASLYQTPLQLWSFNVAHNPAAFTAQHNLGVACINAGNREEGARHVAIALQQAPDDDGIQTTAGKLALSQNNFPSALDHFQHAIALRPNDPAAHVLLGDAYDRMNRLDDAIATFRKAVEVSPRTADGYIPLALALKRNKQFYDAANNFQIAIRLDPGNMITRYNYANLLLDLNRNKDAITNYEFILKYQPDNPAVWDNLAFAYHQDGQEEKAIAAKTREKELESAKNK